MSQKKERVCFQKQLYDKYGSAERGFDMRIFSLHMIEKVIAYKSVDKNT